MPKTPRKKRKVTATVPPKGSRRGTKSNSPTSRNEPKRKTSGKLTAKKTAVGPSRPRSTSRKTKAETASTLFWKLRRILPLLEKSSYFQLSKPHQQFLSQFEGNKTDWPSIEAWTFIIHPAVIDRIVGRDRRLRRYIVTIDTLRSTIYEKVKEFLETRKTNITSYYTGGWADFLCDIQMDEGQFQLFLSDLKSVIKADIERIKGVDRVDEVITSYEVIRPIMMCGKPFRNIATPSDDIIDEVLRDRVRFETVHRNYRSAEAAAFFENNEKKLKAYLSKLKSNGVIVCYDIVFDFSYGIARDFVPMGLLTDQDGPIDKFLNDAKSEPILTKPIREWFKVNPLRPADAAEQEINYLFINEYDLPGERTRWKQAMYRHAEIEVNLYNYPIESTLNESPIYLSDLPDFLLKAKEYENDNKDKYMLVGHAKHSLLSDPPNVWLPISGLAGQGITLGEPNSGKTNTDLVIASEAVKHLKTVVILDCSGGVESKLDTLPEHAVRLLKRRELTTNNEAELSAMITEENVLCIASADKNQYPAIFAKIIQKIEALPDSTSSNEARKVTRLLIVEEAQDAFGVDPNEVRRNIGLLKQVLNKAYRKGWCVWLSTQRLSGFGSEAAELFALFRNRIIGRQLPRELDLITAAFRDDGHPEKDLQYLIDILPQLAAGSAICRAVEVHGNKERKLPPLEVQFRLLTKEDV